METELSSSTSRGRGFSTIFGSKAKPRSLRFQPSGLSSVAHARLRFLTYSSDSDFMALNE